MTFLEHKVITILNMQILLAVNICYFTVGAL